MLIAIISDIHDHLVNLDAALAATDDCSELICLGDLCSPFVVPHLAAFAGPVHVVFGNNDGDRFRITRLAADAANVTLHGEFADLRIGGRRFAINHFDTIGRAIAGNPAFDVICFGHNHTYEMERRDGALIVNPGEIYGGMYGTATCVIYDSDRHEGRRVDL